MLAAGSLKEKVMKVDSVYTVMACAVPMVRWVMRILMTERSMALLLDKKTGQGATNGADDGEIKRLAKILAHIREGLLAHGAVNGDRNQGKAPRI